MRIAEFLLGWPSHGSVRLPNLGLENNGPQITGWSRLNLVSRTLETRPRFSNVLTIHGIKESVSSSRLLAPFFPSFFFFLSSNAGRGESILERINGSLLFPLRSILFFSLPPPLLLFLFLRFGPWSGAATRVARIPETRTGRGGEKTIPRLIVVACSPLVSHASRFYSPRRFNAQQRGSSDLFHFDRGGRGDKRRSRCRALPAFAYQLRGIPFDARRKRRNRKNAWNRDGELMGETRISRTIIVIIRYQPRWFLENHLTYREHDAPILQIFLRYWGRGVVIAAIVVVVDDVWQTEVRREREKK